MLTLNDAKKILQLCPICDDIQTKILLLFLGGGTKTSNIIKPLIKCSDISFHNGSLVERIIMENNTFTLWRLNVFLNKGKCFNKLYIKNLRTIYELKIAYLTNGNCESAKQSHINSLLGSIKTNSDADLFEMFYGLNKDKYKYLGTPTANIIHKAINNNIIKEFEPMIWYEVDTDAEYY